MRFGSPDEPNRHIRGDAGAIRSSDDPVATGSWDSHGGALPIGTSDERARPSEQDQRVPPERRAGSQQLQGAPALQRKPCPEHGSVRREELAVVRGTRGAAAPSSRHHRHAPCARAADPGPEGRWDASPPRHRPSTDRQIRGRRHEPAHPTRADRRGPETAPPFATPAIDGNAHGDAPGGPHALRPEPDRRCGRTAATPPARERKRSWPRAGSRPRAPAHARCGRTARVRGRPQRRRRPGTTPAAVRARLNSSPAVITIRRPRSAPASARRSLIGTDRS